MTEQEMNLQRLFKAPSFKDANYSAEEIADFKEDMDCLRTHYESNMASNIDVPFDELPADVQEWLDEAYSSGAVPSSCQDEVPRRSFRHEMLMGLFYIFAIVTILNLIIIGIRFALI